MPAPKHYRLTIGGIFGTDSAPIEEWQIGVSLGPVDGGPFLVRSDLVASLPALRDAWWTGLAPSISSTARRTWAKVAYVDETGHTPRDVSGAYIQAELLDSPTVPGTGSASVLPLQTALVVTLHTDASGAVGKGRYYLPAPNVGALVNGLMPTLTQTSRINDAALGITNLRAAAATALMGTVVVASAGSSARGLPPALYPVRAISVGRVPDTQRRRRGDLAEDRVLKSVTF